MSKFFHFLIIASFFSLNAFADDSHNPDDKSCIELMRQECSKIDLDYWKNSCDLDFVDNNLVLDEKNRVIAARVKPLLRDSYKKNGYFVKVLDKIGCNHAEKYEVLYFKSRLTASELSCRKTLEIVKEIEHAVFDHDGECIARNPDRNAINNECEIMYKDEVEDGKASCRIYESLGFKVKKSDIAGYDFMIVTNGQDLYF